jgi:hypothetical protein
LQLRLGELYLANRKLAAGSGLLKERLRETFNPNLMTLVPERDLPWCDLREGSETPMLDFAPNGRVDIALGSRPEFDLSRIAQEIVSIYDGVAQKAGRRLIPSLRRR